MICMYDMYVWHVRYVDKYVWRWNEYQQSFYVDTSVDLEESDNENKFNFYYHSMGCILRKYRLSHIKTEPKTGLQNLVTIRMNEVFPYLVCCGQKLKFVIRKSRQR